METWKALGPSNVGAAFDKQLAQDRSVASPLVVAIASRRKIGPMRKRGQEIEELSSVRRLHFRPELPLKRGPRLSGSSGRDRKSTRLNSSHANISYAVFCLKKKKIQ